MLKSIGWIGSFIALAAVISFSLFTILENSGLDTSRNPTINQIKDIVESGTTRKLIQPKNLTINVPKFIEKERKAVVEPVNLRKLTLNPDRTIRVFGPVTFQIMKVTKAIHKLNSVNHDPIFMIITSPGGSVVFGANLIAAMQSSKAPIYTICEGYCASMGAMILEYGTRRYAVDHSLIMFHPATTEISGDVDRINSYIGFISRYIMRIDIDVANKLGISYDAYKQKIVNEWWVSSLEAKDDNVIDQVIYFAFDDDYINDLGEQDDLDAKYNYRGLYKDLKHNTKRDFIWIAPGVLQ